MSRRRRDGDEDAGGLPPAWWVIERASRIGDAPVSLVRLGRRLVAWRDEGGTIRVHDARCPHRGVDLAEGRVVRGELECAYHGLRFDGDGRCTAIPCAGAGARIPASMRLGGPVVRVERGLVWMWSGPPSASLPPLPWPTRMPATDRGSAEASMTWDVPFARAMEAMLDLHHLPFAHRPLAAGVGARLDPWHVTADDGGLSAEGWLRRDDAPAGRSGWRFELEARFPGVVYLQPPGAGGIVACVPVDERRTRITARFFVPVPVIGSLIARLALWVELRLVQPDDERMMLATLRERDDLSGCTLVPADAAIVAWHRLLARSRAPRDPAPSALRAGPEVGAPADGAPADRR